MDTTGWIILAIATGVIGAGLLTRRRLGREHPPTGRLVDIGGYRLHVDVQGTGPTVVLEGGTWAPGVTWRPIQRELAAFTRVVTYDRAGLGWSDPSPHPRTAGVMAAELHELLARAGVPGPYVLVGHSFGGTIVRVFARRHPQLVAGIVLLDGAHEEQMERAPEPVRRFMARSTRVMPIAFRVLSLLAKAGVLALRPSVVPPTGRLPEDVVATVRAQIASRPVVLATMGREIRDLEVGNALVRDMAIDTLGDVPLRVVSHGRPEGTPPQLGPAIAEVYERMWQDLQVAQAGLSTRGERTIAEGVGHDIPGEAPALVVDAVREVLAATADRPSARLADAA